MNFQQIRAFHLVALEGSVRRAAEIMSLSQPTVSQHIKALEDRHSVRLFEKRGRGLVLTDSGTQLFIVTGRLMEQAGAVEDLLSHRAGAASGKLRVVSDSPAIAVQIVRRMLISSPDIDISIRKASVDGIVGALTDLRADVGIAVDPMIGNPLQVVPLRREGLRACIPVNSPLAGREVLALDDLARQTVIMREKTSRTRALIERAMAADGVVPDRIVEVEGAEVVREAVALSLGVSFFSESECPPDPRLIYTRISTRRGKVGFVENLLFRRDRRRVPAIAAFLRAAEDERAGLQTSGD